MERILIDSIERHKTTHVLFPRIACRHADAQEERLLDDEHQHRRNEEGGKATLRIVERHIIVLYRHLHHLSLLISSCLHAIHLDVLVQLQRNYWDVKNATKGYYDKATAKSTKTIYDPSPVGYKVPEPEAFTGFTTTGTNSTSKSTFNVLGNWNKGWTYYTGLNKQGATYYIYTFNDIAVGGTTYYAGFETTSRMRTTGSAESSGYDYTTALYMTSSNINPVYASARRCVALPIIPESND